MSRRALASAGCLLLAGCAVGPDFHTPVAPAGPGYVAPAIAGGAQTIVPGAPVPAEWWHAFGSPALDTLVAAALAHNSDLAAQRAALRAARETWLASRSVLLPTLDAGAQTTRNRSSQYLQPVTNDPVYAYSLQTAQVTVGYTVDLFGGGRRQIEQARAQYDAQGFEAEAARQTLIANVVAGAITLAALNDQLAANASAENLARQQAEIARRQHAQGQIAGPDLQAREAAVANVWAAAVPLIRQHDAVRDALADLVGQAPVEALPHPDGPSSFDLGAITLPADLPLTLPADLVRQRPDVRAAEANLHAASAAVGVAVAARLPAITLGASGGGQSADWSNIFAAANGMWSLGAGLAQPIFAGGRLLHQQKAAEAQLDQARALYRSAVLAAFQNVADALTALSLDAHALATAETLRDSAQRTAEIAERQYRTGEISRLAELDAEQALVTAESAEAAAEAQRLTDTAALYQALGGGWGDGDANPR